MVNTGSAAPPSEPGSTSNDGTVLARSETWVTVSSRSSCAPSAVSATGTCCACSGTRRAWTMTTGNALCAAAAPCSAAGGVVVVWAIAGTA